MSCSTHSTCELYFPIPRNGEEKDFIIYFYPDNNEQRPVIRCEAFQGSHDCINEPGFGWKRFNSTHGLITLPTHIAAESGSFRSQVPGHDEPRAWKCSWTSVESCPADNPTITTEADYSTTTMRNETLSPQSESYKIEGNAGLAVGLSVGLCVLVIVVIAVFMLVKKCKSIKGLKKNGISIQSRENVPKQHKSKIYWQSENLLEQGQVNATKISDSKNEVTIGCQNENNGMHPEQLTGALQNLLTEVPSKDKKGSDHLIISADILGSRNDGHTSDDNKNENSSQEHLPDQEYRRVRKPSSSSESDSSMESEEESHVSLKSLVHKC